ncbi:MAG: DUF6273 domain-containing protein [Clostridia bacterium]|nr:DUF6273 domain-containing protein [Clostridia bacterium]
MFCGKCGNQISDTAKFCGKCGAKTGETPEPGVSPEKFNHISAAGNNQKTNKGKKCKNRLIAVVSAVLALVLVLIAGTLMLKGAKKREVTKSLKSAQTGDIVTFGNYEQDGNTSNGAEPIKWLVLDRQGDRMLVISRYALDCQTYNTTYTAVTWETCTLRNWLNTEFYNTAFSDSEKASVITTTIENPNNAEYGTKGGNATDDKVFCLSIDEATRYFATHEARVTKATEYAISRGAWTWTKKDQLAGSCFWWLRSSGYSQKDAATVFYDGYVDGSGHRVDDDDKYAVRPAMWIAVNP